MRLTVEALSVEDTWKDIVRIHEPDRLDEDNNQISRGTICRIRTGDKSKWVVARGLSKKRGVIQMDRNVRDDLGVETGDHCDFTLERLRWVQSLWFPWKASDPMYRIPAQLGLISLILGAIGLGLGVISLLH
jgi:hypothetical protein